MNTVNTINTSTTPADNFIDVYDLEFGDIDTDAALSDSADVEAVDRAEAGPSRGRVRDAGFHTAEGLAAAAVAVAVLLVVKTGLTNVANTVVSKLTELVGG
jgi:hypothetical protein